jgi:hypothetical protein
VQSTEEVELVGDSSRRCIVVVVTGLAQQQAQSREQECPRHEIQTLGQWWSPPWREH